MHFHKQPSPDCLAPLKDLASPVPDSPRSLTLASPSGGVHIDVLEDDWFHLTFDHEGVDCARRTPPLAGRPVTVVADSIDLNEASDGSGAAWSINSGSLRLLVAHTRFSLGLELLGDHGGTVIPLDPTQMSGFNGNKFGLGLRMPAETNYYGFGEKTGRLNKRGQRMKFWNVDVCADHPYGNHRPDYDPTYCAIPLAIFSVPRDPADVEDDPSIGLYGAVLIDNGGAAWFSCQNDAFLEPDFFYFGTYSGSPSFYLTAARSLDELCARIVRLTGKAKMPPLWSLGHHQCRWGYDRESTYRHIVEQYKTWEIPLSALWLDIDYMDRYRVFTWHDERVPNPKALSNWIHDHNVKLVTIIDPGVARCDDFQMYTEGRDGGHFCLAPSGQEFIGMVWPGKTAFPDFSREETREWWANHLVLHLDLGVDGIWNDMNDPATGECDVDDMLFQRGEVPHEHFHNLYGTLMAEATWMGFRKMDPDTRPFILTRSASTGVQQYAAVWTGDNVSSWDHLRMCIPESVNLSLSGVSFNGPDVGGFMENTNAELLTRWYEACLLFPFFRNHSNSATSHQEPWCFGTATADALRDVIRLRYRLLGYLYTQMARYVADGLPVLRPLCSFHSGPEYADIDDAYAVGSDVIVAPIVQEGGRRRHILLPPGRWWDLGAECWRAGDRWFERDVELDDVPIFVRECAIIAEPIPASGSGFIVWDHDLEACSWRLHVFGERASGRQMIDDGSAWCDSPAVPYALEYAGARCSGTMRWDRVHAITIYGDAPQRVEVPDGVVFDRRFPDAEPLHPRATGVDIVTFNRSNAK